MASRIALASTALLAGAAALAAAAAVAEAAAAPSGDAAHGKMVFAARCGLCHSAGDVGEAGQGPPLAGVVGRMAAASPDFDYTAALKASHLSWTPANLDRFLAGPSMLVPGTAMPIAVADAKTRADLIAYLATVKGS